MSFLHDEKFYIPLLNSLQKKAQDAKSAVNSISVAKKLVNSLSRELTSQPEPPNVAASTDAELKVDNLQSLGTLLKFLSTNKVTINGLRVAYTGVEEASLSESESEKNKLSPVTINESRDAATRKWNTADYYTNLPYLINYVKYLQAKAAAMTKGGDVQGKVLEVMVGKLIDQVNAIKPDSGLSRKPKSTPDAPNEIPDEDIIDNFGTKIFDAKNPHKDKGSLLLKAKHVKSRTALNSWLQDAPEAQILMYDDKGQVLPSPKSPLLWTNNNSNHCNVITSLYARAKHLKEIARSSEDEKKADFYIKKIQEIGPTFTSPDGKACLVSTSLPSQLSKPGDPVSNEAPKYDVNTMLKVIGNLPLRVETLDFDKVDQFFAEYVKLNPNATVWRNSAIQYRDDALDLLLPPIAAGRRINLMAGPKDILTWLKPPQVNKGNPYVPFINQLKMFLKMVGDALGDLKARYADTESGEAIIKDPIQIARINAQILGNNSIWATNNTTLNTWLSQVGSVLPTHSEKKKYTY